jgi:hypothetical protein
MGRGLGELLAGGGSMARLVYRLRNDGSEDVDVVGINDGDDLTASEALVILLKALAGHLDAVSENLDNLR